MITILPDFGSVFFVASDIGGHVPVEPIKVLQYPAFDALVDGGGNTFLQAKVEISFGGIDAVELRILIADIAVKD